jgi:NAD(P)H-nitrite reductase large subunit
MGQEVKEIVKNTQGAVEAVILKNGEKIPCNIVVVGMGVKPATDFLARNNSMISQDKNGGIVCNPYL